MDSKKIGTAKTTRSQKAAPKTRTKAGPSPRDPSEATTCRYTGCTNPPLSYGYCNDCIATFM